MFSLALASAAFRSGVSAYLSRVASTSASSSRRMVPLRSVFLQMAAHFDLGFLALGFSSGIEMTMATSRSSNSYTEAAL